MALTRLGVRRLHSRSIDRGKESLHKSQRQPSSSIYWIRASFLFEDLLQRLFARSLDHQTLRYQSRRG